MFLSDWTKDLKRDLTKEDTEMANRQLRKVSTSLATRERQITSTRTRHRLSIRVAETAPASRVGLRLCTWPMGSEAAQALWKAAGQFL